MAALFPRWSNTAMRLGLTALGAAVLGTPAALLAYVRSPYVTGQYTPIAQPVEFDHRHHVGDAGIDCRYCHADVERSRVAGLPAVEVCMGCHAQVWRDSPMLEPVRRAYFAGAALPWRRVHDLPDHVYFHHAIHLRKGVGCVACHGRVDRMARVYQVAPLTMGWCLGCHRAPERHLRPRERVTDMGWAPPDDGGALGRRLAAAYGVRRPTHCSACHR